MRIKYLSAPTASGKTTALVETIRPGSPSIVATSRQAVSCEIAETFRAAGRDVKLIRGKNDKNDGLADTYSNCTKAFKDAIKAGHEIIIVDHSVAMKNVPGIENYDLYIDEVPTIEKSLCVRSSLPAIQNVLLSLFPSGKISDSHLFYEMAYTKELADIIAAYDDDEAVHPSKKFKALCEALKSDDHKVVIRASSLQRYEEALQNEPNRISGTKLKFHIITQPSVLQNYRSVTIMGANFYNSELHFAWRSKTDFVEHTDMKMLLRSFPDHQKGLVHIRYLSESHDTWAALQKLDYQHFLNSVAVAFDAAYPNTPHIFAVKKAKDKNGKKNQLYEWPLEEKGLGTRLDPSAKGVNGFQHINVAIHLTPINPKTSDYNFKREFFGMDSNDVKRAVAYEAQYQFASRTSYRNYESKDPVTVIVLDRTSAISLKELFGEACAEEPKFFDIGIEALRAEKKKARTAAERKSKSREEARRKQNKATTDEFQYEGYRMRLWTSAERTTHEILLSWSSLVIEMRKYHRTLHLKSKSPYPQFREGYFLDLTNHKLVNNIKTSKIIQFDVDFAKKPPKELSKFLKNNNISHLITNSYSSTPGDPRFHLLIPLDRVVSGDEYTQIFNLVRADIIQKFGDAFEIDASFKSINKRVSVPCVSNYEGNIFIDGTVRNSATFRISFLDVERYLNRVPIKADKPAATRQHWSKPASTTTDAIESIINGLAVAPGLGKGNDNFFNAGVELIKLGCSQNEVVRILDTNKHRFGHGKDRCAEDVASYIFKNSRHVHNRSGNTFGLNGSDT